MAVLGPPVVPGGPGREKLHTKVDSKGMGTWGNWPDYMPTGLMQNESHTSDKASAALIPAWQPFSLWASYLVSPGLAFLIFSGVLRHC